MYQNSLLTIIVNDAQVSMQYICFECEKYSLTVHIMLVLYKCSYWSSTLSLKFFEVEETYSTEQKIVL
jgi:hypothetical protein